MKRAAVFLCLGMLCSGFCLAQRGGGRRGGGGRAVASRSETEDQTIALLGALLDFKDPQPQKLRSILDAALAEAIPLRTRADTEDDPVIAAVRNGKSEEEVAKIAQEQASASGQMRVIAARAFAKIYRILTPEQQNKADSFLYDQIVVLLERGEPSAPASSGKP